MNRVTKVERAALTQQAMQMRSVKSTAQIAQTLGISKARVRQYIAKQVRIERGHQVRQRTG